jgi:predicted nucleic acid-binding protein
MALVVDASIVVAWFVIGQATALTRKALTRAANEVLYAPPLIQVQLASALVKLAHRRKIALAAVGEILTQFEALDVVMDRTPATARAIASTCRRHALSAYDATYLELTMRLKLPLAAKDGPLLDAAREAGLAFA